jgi:hypothetical protein
MLQEARRGGTKRKRGTMAGAIAQALTAGVPEQPGVMARVTAKPGIMANIAVLPRLG